MLRCKDMKPLLYLLAFLVLIACILFFGAAGRVEEEPEKVIIHNTLDDKPSPADGRWEDMCSDKGC